MAATRFLDEDEGEADRFDLEGRAAFVCIALQAYWLIWWPNLRVAVPIEGRPLDDLGEDRDIVAAAQVFRGQRPGEE